MKFLRKEQGFTGMDIMIAVIVVTLFTGLIVTLSYNIYLAVTSVDKISKANSYVVDIFEEAELAYYDQIDEDATFLINAFNTKHEEKEAKAIRLDNGEEIINPFKVEIEVEKYTPPETSGLPNLDLVKTIRVKISYEIGLDNIQVLEMTKVKARETLETPNAPDMNSLAAENLNIEQIKPIKYVNNKWQVCDAKDANWYNYNNGVWATVLVTNYETNLGAEIESNNLENMGEVYVWVPRYSYNDGTTPKEIRFNYGTGLEYVKTEEIGNDNFYQTIEEIETGYKCDLFDDGEEKLRGRWISEETVNRSCKSKLL